MNIKMIVSYTGMMLPGVVGPPYCGHIDQNQYLEMNPRDTAIYRMLLCILSSSKSSRTKKNAMSVYNR